MGGSKRNDSRSAEAGKAGRRPHMGILEARALVRLAEAEGEDEVRRRVGPVRYALYQEWVATFPKIAKEWAPIMEAMARSAASFSRAVSPLVRSLSRTAVVIAAARQGDREAILRLLRWNPLFALSDLKIAERIEKIGDSAVKEDKHFLEKVADHFRVGLLRPRSPGRPRILDADKAAVVVAIQMAFDRIQPIKRDFRNKDLQAKEFDLAAGAIAGAAPERYRSGVLNAARSLLEERPRLGRTFGLEAAAIVFRCTTRSIRASLQRFTR